MLNSFHNQNFRWDILAAIVLSVEEKYKNIQILTIVD